MNSDDEVHSVGWDAINAALAPIYGKREPKHYAPSLPAILGGKDPLQGISAYKNVEPLPHFHYVTFGFSELYGKEGDDPGSSGFGFELTFRLACRATDEEPPKWVLNFLQNIARYVFSTGNRLGQFHYIDLNGPIALGLKTSIGYIALAKDPQLGEIETQNGRVEFLQVVGLCADEYELVKQWDCAKMLDRLGARWPMLITDLNRHSILEDPSAAAEIRSFADIEGSSQAELFASRAEWRIEDDALRITLSATAVRDILKLFGSRIAHSHAFGVYGREQGVLFQPAAESSWKTDDGLAIVSLSPATVRQILASLEPKRGRFSWPGLAGVRIEVVPSEIKDQDGNVVSVIG